MYIYIVVFVASLLFSFFATRTNNKRRIIILSLISILIPSILGGLRSVSIGTDVALYVAPDMKAAYNASHFTDFVSRIYGSREPGYLAVVYGISRLTDNVQWVLFAMQFITIGGIYYGAYKHKKKISVPLVLGIFFLLFYNQSYNLVRQYMGLGIVFASLYRLENKEYKRFIICIVIATCFHYTSLIALLLLFVKWLLENKLSSGLISRDYLVGGAVVFAVVFLEQIVNVFVVVGLLSPAYLRYFRTDTGTGIGLTEILFYVVVLLMFLLTSKNLRNRVDNFRLFRINLLAVVSILILGVKLYYGSRLCLCFQIINMLLIASMPTAFRKGASRRIFTVSLVGLMSSYWIYIYCIAKTSATVPYVPFF